MVVEQVIRIFRISYLWDIQNTSGITLNRNYIRNADINKLCDLTKNLKTNKEYYNEEGKNGEKNRH